MGISNRPPCARGATRAFALIALVAGLVLAAPIAGAAPLFTTGVLGHAVFVQDNYTATTMLADGSAIVAGSYKGVGAGAGTFDLGGSSPLPNSPSGTTYGFVARLTAAGGVAWQLPLDTTANDYVNVTDAAGMPDGSVVIVGFYRGTAQFGNITVPTASDSSMFAAKVRVDGTGFAWVRTASSTGAVFAGTVSVAADGSPVVAGSFDGTLTIAGRTLPSAGDSDVVVAKVSSDGSAFDWAVRGGGAYEDWADGVAVAADGSAVIAGVCADIGSFGSLTIDCSGGSFDHPLVAKVKADGSGWAWALAPPVGDDSSADDVALLPDGSAAVAVTFRTSATFGSTIFQTGPGDDRGAVTRVRADGSGYTWASQIDSGVSDSWINAIEARPDGSVVALGSFTGVGTSAVFGATTLTGVADANVFVTQVSGSGTFTSATLANTTGYWYGNALSSLPDGSSVIVGNAIGTATFGATSLVTAVTSVASGNRDFFAAGILLAPVAPAAPTATAGVASATVATTPLVGPAITRYTVTASPGGRTCSIAPPATSCTVDGLTGGTSYTFTATAENAAGTSAASAASGVVTPAKATSSTPRLTRAPRIVRTPATVTLISNVRVGAAGTLAQRATYGGSARAGRTVAACTATVKAKKAGTVTITCKLNAKARAALRKGALKLTLTTTFTETGKTATSTTRRITVPRTKPSTRASHGLLG